MRLAMPFTCANVEQQRPAYRKGYMPSPMLARAVKEAQRRGVPIEEQIVAWGERERA